MRTPNQDPSKASATPDDLGSVFRDCASWLMENGTVELEQIINPSRDDGNTRGFIFDGEVICDLLPEQANTLDITPVDNLQCTFFPPYLEEDASTGKEVTRPPECSFYIGQDDSSLVQSVVFDLTLLFTQTDDWLATGAKKTNYKPLRRTVELSDEEVARLIIERATLSRMLPPDPISPEECAALQVIADNFPTLKQAQDARPQ